MSAKKKERKGHDIAQLLRKPDTRLLYEQERLLLATQECLASAIEESGLTQAEVARRIGHDRSFITNALSGGRNLTLKTVASLAWATSRRVGVSAIPFAETVYGTPLYSLDAGALRGGVATSCPRYSAAGGLVTARSVGEAEADPYDVAATG